MGGADSSESYLQDSGGRRGLAAGLCSTHLLTMQPAPPRCSTHLRDGDLLPPKEQLLEAALAARLHNHRHRWRGAACRGSVGVR